jgi:hypothetical protein
MRLYLNDLVGPRLDERHAGSRRSHDGQLLYYGAPLALLGAASILSGSIILGRAAAAARILLLAFVFYSVVFHSLANLPISVPLFLAVHARFWQMPNSSVFIFVGIGFEFVCRRLEFRNGPRWVLALICIYLQLVYNFETQDQSENRAVEQLTRTALETLPERAIVLCSGDLQFNPSLYFTVCERVDFGIAVDPCVPSLARLRPDLDSGTIICSLSLETML